MLHILSFLDGNSFVTAAAVSRAFRNVIAPRQRNVSISGFHSYENMKQMNFTAATFFSGRDSELVANNVLADLAESFPRLNSVDLSGCWYSSLSKSLFFENLITRLISPYLVKTTFRKDVTNLDSFMTARKIEYTGPSTSNWRYC